MIDEIDQIGVGLLCLSGTEVVAANTAAHDVLGVAHATLVGTDLAARFAADDVGGSGSIATGIRRLRDERRWIDCVVTPRDAATGSPAEPDAPVPGQSWVVVRDVTDAVRTRRIAGQLANTISVVDAQGTRTWGPIGREVPEAGGYPDSSVVDRLHPEDLADVIDVWSKVRDTPGSRAFLEVRLRDIGLGERWSQARIRLANCEDVDEIGGLLVTADEITSAEVIESIGGTSGAYLSIAEAAPVGIIVLGPLGFPLFFNEAAKALLPGIGPGDADRDWIARAHPEHEPALREILDLAVEEHKTQTLLARFGPSAQGTPPQDAEDADAQLWLMTTVAPRLSHEGEALGLVVTLQDVTAEITARQQLEATQEKLLHYATHDPLTGLANRTLLTAPRDPGAGAGELGALFCDLDGFKRVNDELGHDVGDQVLIEVAERLRRVARRSDVVARIGGDEFLILVPGSTPADLDALRERVIDTVPRPILVDGRDASVGISVGAALVAPDDSIFELVRRADRAMYRHKSERRKDDLP
jgi:diguanylate cyclase (GGDEF)-like protein